MKLKELLKLPPTRILSEVRTRPHLRAYIDARLPGWHCWLDVALATLNTCEQDETQLFEKKDIVARLEMLGCEMRKELGALGRRIGEAYAQEAPFSDISVQIPLEAYTRWQGEGPELGMFIPAAERRPVPLTDDGKGARPFSHAQLGGRVASRDVIGNVLALGHLHSLNRQRQTGLEKRRWQAVQMVALEFQSFIGKPGGKAVLPNRHRDPDFDESLASTKKVKKALATVVAAYLGHHDEYSPELKGRSRKLLAFPASIFKRTDEKLTKALKAPDENAWLIPQGTLAPTGD